MGWVNPLALFISNYRSYFSFAYLFSSGEKDTMPGMAACMECFSTTCSSLYRLVGLSFILLSAIKRRPYVKESIFLVIAAILYPFPPL